MKIINSILGRKAVKEESSNSVWDLLPIYNRIGIHNCAEPLSGEAFFIDKVLPSLLDSTDRDRVFFDVGANLGSYASLLNGFFKTAIIHCFEPLPKTYLKLKSNLEGEEFILRNFGFSNEEKNLNLYFSANGNFENEHASVYKGALGILQNEERIESANVQFKTIDQYCVELKIEKIDFLKIDTEGHEFAVLQGASGMISNEAIEIIQFEFNEMNVISRTFLKDFYELLPNFEFYRLMPKGLKALGEYNSINEIFQFQNILAINKRLVSALQNDYYTS